MKWSTLWTQISVSLAYLVFHNTSQSQSAVKQLTSGIIDQDQRDPSFKDGIAAYGVSKCMYLAKNQQAAALVNPDNYRIFAEMSMSPKTVWQPPSS